MNQPDTSRIILERIRSESIRPIPAWRFRLRRILIWISLIGFTLFGSLAVALVFSDFPPIDLNPLHWSEYRARRILLSAVPWVWGLLFVLFAGLSFRQFRNLPRGYRFSAVRLVTISLLLSLTGGWLLHASGIDERMQRRFARQMRFMRHFQDRLQARWMSPGEGFILGSVEQWNPGNPISGAGGSLQIRDPDGRLWTIDVTGAEWRGTPRIRMEGRVRVIGRKLSDSDFKAEFITPWPGGFQHRPGFRPPPIEGVGP